MADKIILETNFRRIPQNEFEKIDYIVTGECFQIQNEFGRFFDEKIYQDELEKRLSPLFEKVQTEVPITACFKDFQKPYYADLVINDSAIYELKVTNSISPAHKSQTLDYLYLAELAHGKIVNFGSQKVETEFVSTKLDHQSRRQFTIMSDLDVSEERSAWFWGLVQRLLKHFGSYISTGLFYDAIEYFADWEILGDAQVKSTTSAVQRAHLLSPQVAFKLTSYPEDRIAFKGHLQKFLNNTNLSKIHWVNIYRDQINATTLNEH